MAPSTINVSRSTNTNIQSGFFGVQVVVGNLCMTCQWLERGKHANLNSRAGTLPGTL